MDDKTKSEPVDEDVVMQQSYPSPMVENGDAQYYEIPTHREHEPSIAPQQGPELPAELPDLTSHQPDHEHHDLHELQELQESPTPQQQHDSRPPVTADEDLQLAAQLTQGLAQGMNQGMSQALSSIIADAQMAVVQSQAQQEQAMPQEHQTEVPTEPEPDSLQQQLEVSLQNHDHELALQSQNHALQNHIHEHELQNHNHELQPHEHELSHEHELQSQNHDLQVHDGLPHPEQQQAHHYPQSTTPQSHLPPHLSMDHIPNVHPQYQMSDTTPPRKRSKVSRACDECRRKKIKCDAQSEASEQPCSNCRRSSAQCLFSRVPQKRGPSKGYIKELADRINTIEGKLNTSVSGDSIEDPGRRSSSEAFASPSLGDDSRKRPFANISGDSGYLNNTPGSNQPSPYTTDHRQLSPYVHQDYRPANTDNPNDLALRAIAPMPSFGVPGDVGLQPQPDGMMDGVTQNGIPQGASHQPEQLLEIEDNVFNRYLEVLHPTFPLLASTKARVQSLLWQSPFTLQNAFYQAFFTMVRPFLGANANVHTAGDLLVANRLLGEWEAEGGQRSTATDLVRLQTLVMMVIATDCHGIAVVNGQSGGPWKAEILGKAVGLGYSMRLHLREIEPLDSPELDPNSDDNVALRAWWVLFMLDRWNAVGTATPSMISIDSVLILPGLKHIVGDVVLALIRLSHVLGYIVPLAIRAPMDPTSIYGAPIIGSTTGIAAEMARAYFPEGRTDPILHLSYWHIRLLIELLSPSRHPVRVLEASKKIVNILAGNHEMLSPLTHHFLVLTSLALLDLSNDAEAEVRDGAAKLIADIMEYSLSPSPWNEAVRGRLAEWFTQNQQGPEQQQQSGTTTGTSVEEIAGAGLQQLADLATAVDGIKDEPPVTGASDPVEATSQPQEPQPLGTEEQQQQQPQPSSTTSVCMNLMDSLRAGYLTCFSPVSGDSGPAVADVKVPETTTGGVE
ncbi:glucose transport transcription regulator RGT1 [Podospora fimiseda]|uniref:Glucose transport transcription regulator RGT1 n=1 Tax=Podospora fimiseda TaxID=252190 RepID=A0AAN7H6T3_9PEZI|nr:glucose transport transcription regulator RGT1 [Podospora fimiseda]